ncbi:PEP-CTERM sorting domain-containing protein [Desulfatiferula olefinivorans]
MLILLKGYKNGDAPVPEQATLILLGSGLLGFAASRKRKKHKAIYGLRRCKALSQPFFLLTDQILLSLYSLPPYNPSIILLPEPSMN